MICKFEDKFLGILQKVSHILGRGQKQWVEKLTLSFVDVQAPKTKYSKLWFRKSQSLWFRSFKKSFTLTLVQKLQVKLHNYSGWKASRKASHLLLLKSFKLTETLVKKRSSSVSWGGGRRKYIISCHFDRWHVCKLYV